MTLTPVYASLTSSWLLHDSWSESYVGARRLIYEVLPAPDQRLSAEECAMCQLALVGANHLMEIALYKILLPHAKNGSASLSLTPAFLEDASYFLMLTKWLPATCGVNLDLKAEPFASTERLRRRRNETIHKTSAFATHTMARSAIYSAVDGVKTLYSASGSVFPYEAVLGKCPQQVEEPFSSVAFPADP